MSKLTKLFAVLGVATSLVACTAPDNSEVEEFVIIDPAPLTDEPEFTGKAK